MEKEKNFIQSFYQQVEEQIAVKHLTQEDNKILQSQLNKVSDVEKNDIVNKLFLLNAKLVYTFVKPYLGKGFDTNDLFLNGCEGLVEGLKRFNPELGYALSTYCVTWIKKYIFKFMYQDAPIYIPEYLTNDYIKLTKVKEELEQSHGEVDENILMEKTGFDKEKIDKLLNLKATFVSLDKNIDNGDGDELYLKDIIPDNNSISIDEYIYRNSLTETINNILNELTDNERTVLQYRFGLNEQPVLSLQSIGEKMGISAERVRQIEKTGIRKLRNEHRKKILEGYRR